MKNIGAIFSGLSKVLGRTGLSVKAFSPEILLILGIGGGITATVMACVATRKVDDVIAIKDEKMEEINLALEKVKTGELQPEEYTDKMKNKDLFMTYVETGWDFIKLYGPAITLGAVSIVCTVGGHKILKTRNIALMAAYQAVEKGFAAYRKRVVEEFGEEKDYQYKNGLYAKDVTETVTDENGKTEEVTTTQIVSTGADGMSVYARFFDKSNPEWESGEHYNVSFIKRQQNYWNDILVARGHVFLSEVYDSLGFERTEASMIVGWIHGGNGDNFIDFGVFDGDSPRARAFVNGTEKNVLLDFNVDGVIYKLFTKKKV